jgi:predicted nucleic acid-binding protein
MIYFDTTYLVRCYLEDPGFEQVRSLAEANEVACVRFGQLETVAAFHRKRREAALTTEQFSAVLNQFETDIAGGVFSWLTETDTLFARVRDAFRGLPPSVFVRTADALHLVCANENGFREVYSNDRHLLAAAAHFGLAAVNVIG